MNVEIDCVGWQAEDTASQPRFVTVGWFYIQRYIPGCPLSSNSVGISIMLGKKRQRKEITAGRPTEFPFDGLKDTAIMKGR